MTDTERPQHCKPKSRCHRCEFVKDGDHVWYRLSWTANLKGRGKFSTPYHQWKATDESGAKRFCKKWNLDFESIPEWVPPWDK